MLLSGFIKFFVLAALTVFSASACRFFSGGSRAVPTPTPFAAEELKSEIPFSTKEPEIFQAELVLTANDAERVIFVARNGARRRTDYNFGAANQITYLQTDANVMILPKRKIYAEDRQTENAHAPDDWTLFLTTEWLNAATEASFERLETTDNLTKYRVTLDGKQASEILIFLDETHKIPVRQEFYSVFGDQKTLNYKFEIRNLETQTDENLFAVPDDYRKVPLEELRKVLNADE